MRGTRGSVKYLSIGTQLGHYGKRMGMPPISFLDSSQLTFFKEIPKTFITKYRIKQDELAKDDQYFEILISKHEPSEEILKQHNLNYLRLDDKEDGTLIVRQTFGLRGILYSCIGCNNVNIVLIFIIETEKKAIIRLERFEMDSESGYDEDEKKSETLTTSDGRPKALTPIQVDEALTAASKLVFGAGLMFSN